MGKERKQASVFMVCSSKGLKKSTGLKFSVKSARNGTEKSCLSIASSPFAIYFQEEPVSVASNQAPLDSKNHPRSFSPPDSSFFQDTPEPPDHCWGTRWSSVRSLPAHYLWGNVTYRNHFWFSPSVLCGYWVDVQNNLKCSNLKGCGKVMLCSDNNSAWNFSITP